jgi:hypothetical protein
MCYGFSTLNHHNCKRCVEPFQITNCRNNESWLRKYCTLRVQRLPTTAQLRCTEMALDCVALHTSYTEIILDCAEINVEETSLIGDAYLVYRNNS